MKFGLKRYFSKKISNSDFDYEIFIKSLTIFLLFWLSVLFVYTFPIGLDKLFFAIILFIFWYSKVDYFWYAFFIVISLFPGSFFTENSGDAFRRLPIYTFIPKVSFSVFDIFMMVSLIKAMVKGKRIRVKDVLNVKYGLIFIIYLIVVSSFHGFTLKTFISMPLRGLFFYTFFYSFPSLVRSNKDTIKFMYMFFPFVFIELFSQIYLLSTGKNLVSFFYSGAATSVIRDKLMGDNIRAIANGYSIIVLSFMFALALLANLEKSISKSYLFSVIICTCISIMLSATRQTIIMFAFMFVLYFVFVNKAKPGVFVQLFIAALFVFFIIDFFNIFNLSSILNASINRLAGAVEISGGKIEAEDTLDYRLTNRLPMILENIKQSFFLGFGFSDKYFQIYDGHLGGLFVGIMQIGIFGYSALIFFVITIFKRSLYYVKIFGNNISSSGIIKALLIGISGYFLVNIFIDPVIVFNFSAKPHEFFLLIILISQFVKFGKMEYFYKKNLRKSILNDNGKSKL